MSDEPQNQPEFICLNQLPKTIKDGIKNGIFIEIESRMARKESFKLEVKFEAQSMYGDWAAVKFTPPKPNPTIEVIKL